MILRTSEYVRKVVFRVFYQELEKIFLSINARWSATTAPDPDGTTPSTAPSSSKRKRKRSKQMGSKKQ